MSWFVLAIISVFTISISNIFQRILMKEDSTDPILFSAVFQFFCAGIIAIFALLRGFVMPSFSLLAINLLLTGILYALYNIFLFKSLKTIQASEVSVLTSSRVIWILFGAIIFLGETLTIQKIIGIFLIVVGVLYISIKGSTLSFSEGKAYAFLAAFFFGGAFINDGYILKHVEVFSYSSISFFIPGLFILLYRPQILLKLNKITNTHLKNITILSVFYSVALVTIYLAYQNGGQASQLGPIGLSVSVITVLLAAVFLKEKDHLIKKIVSAILVIIGVSLLR